MAGAVVVVEVEVEIVVEEEGVEVVGLGRTGCVSEGERRKAESGRESSSMRVWRRAMPSRQASCRPRVKKNRKNKSN